MKQSHLVQKISNTLKQKILLGDYEVGAHLNTQEIADNFMVSRSPARQALVLLHEEQYVEQRKNRGFFVLPVKPTKTQDESEVVYHEEPSEYFRLAEDWLNNEIPSEVTEQFLREKYELTKLQVIDILNKASRVGWAEPKSGYGWRFLEVAKTPETLEQIYRMRMLLEPASLMEPSFRRDRVILAELRKKQQNVLDGDVDKMPTEMLMKTNINFHEELAKLSGNPFHHMFIVQLNNMRRLIEYRSLVDRKRLYQQSAEHLQLIELVERNENLEAAHFMKEHLQGALSLKSPTLRLRNKKAEKGQ